MRGRSGKYLPWKFIKGYVWGEDILLNFDNKSQKEIYERKLILDKRESLLLYGIIDQKFWSLGLRKIMIWKIFDGRKLEEIRGGKVFLVRFF